MQVKVIIYLMASFSSVTSCYWFEWKLRQLGLLGLSSLKNSQMINIFICLLLALKVLRVIIFIGTFRVLGLLD